MKKKDLLQIELSKSGAIKALKGEFQLYFADLDSSIKSCTPGKWVSFVDKKKNLSYLGFINPLVMNSSPCAHIVEKICDNSFFDFGKLLRSAINYRRSFGEQYKSCARMVYGGSDSLPGLIVDSFENIILVQINLAGIEIYRKEIKEILELEFEDKKIYFLDNEKYREAEFLPKHEKEQISEDIFLNENGLKYRVSKDVMQKIGFYYDHRENRKKLSCFLNNYSQQLDSGIDLFSYVGAWGMTLLKAGVKNVSFVDQGDFSCDISYQAKENGFFDQINFIRDDVFNYLKSSSETFDIVCCDPPAFCKSKKEAKKAYEGYSKLHRLALSKVNDGGFFVACSCTQYISHEEFNKNIIDASYKENLKLRLLELGIQGFDHPIESYKSKNSYLKYFIFKVEKK
ncbi:MAG: class I SAM-dependent methyltransferase [Bacteriovoracaceae bacterium]|jgi:23S rRNA (cytosine1962-C5)-methyltransferase|nr:class I SAM-dependent methyltransferase [Bacteriovoracaceae bacterium]